MSAVHQTMGISNAEFVFFNDQVVSVFALAGASAEDQVAVRIVLNGLKEAIVMQNSICDRYSKALNMTNKMLVTSVVLKTFGKITANNSPIKKYFDGTKPAGSVNFLSPQFKGALDGLVDGLTSWFGDALMCSDNSIAPYTGPSLDDVHRSMFINVDEFHFFNGKVIEVLQGAGVKSADIVAVSRALNSTKSVIVFG